MPLDYRPGLAYTTAPGQDKLFSSDLPRHVDTVTIAAGQNFPRGALLGKVTIGGEYKLSVSAAVDGSETPDAIALDSCDSSAGTRPLPVAFSGCFNPHAVTFGAGHTLASVRDGLRLRGLFFRSYWHNA
jgi:hypothetical protein